MSEHSLLDPGDFPCGRFLLDEGRVCGEPAVRARDHQGMVLMVCRVCDASLNRRGAERRVI